MPEGQVVEESQEIGDIVRAQFDKANELPDTPATTVSDATPAPEPPKESAERARGPDGKFAPKTAEAPVTTTPAVAPIEGAVEAPKVYKAPPGWKAGPEKWAQLPPDAQEFFANRERDYNQGIQQYAQMAGVGQAMFSEFQPYLGMLQTVGATPQGAVRYLLNAYAQLTTGTPAQKLSMLAQIAKEQGVDLAGMPADGPQIDPTVADLQKRLAEVTQYLHSTHQHQQNQQQSEVHSQIDAFALDPAHEHFESVRPAMAALLQGGQAKDLNEAYEAACWANPTVRASLNAQREAQASEKRKKEAEAAQRAAVTLTGAPTASGKGLGDLSLRGALEEQFRASGRV